MVNIIAVAGGSGSGKTTLARKIQAALSAQGCAILGQDSYYIDQSKKFDRDGGAVNFDHPSALDFQLLAEHLKQLKSGKDIEVPIYDFTTHSRQKNTDCLKCCSYILVDGTLILSQPLLLPLFDESVFLEVDEDLRFQRRLKRDTQERGRTPEGVKTQFFSQVKPMHDEFVEPSKKSATLLVRGNNVVVQAKRNPSIESQLIEIIKK